MKRTAAIEGPTPALLRWAIAHGCQFRDLDTQNLPDGTFRELRILRAASVALLENRVIDNIALHPDVGQDHTDTPDDGDGAETLHRPVPGFPMSEAVDVHGGCDAIQQQCGDCPANVNLVAGTAGPESQFSESQISESKTSELKNLELKNSNSEISNPEISNSPISRSANLPQWAGCFGWLPFDEVSGLNESNNNQRGFQRLMRPQPTKDPTQPAPNWPVEFEQAIQSLGLQQKMQTAFGKSALYWFAVWSRQQLSGDELNLVRRVMEAIKLPENEIDFYRLRQAVQTCDENKLTLHVQLTPRGNSDGVTWFLEPQCQKCGVTRERDEAANSPCPVCKTRIEPSPPRKPKVLGLRPYLDMTKVIGPEAAAALAAKKIDQ